MARSMFREVFNKVSKPPSILMVAGMVAMMAAMAGPAVAQVTTDRHAGYYYPSPQSSEEYIARVDTVPGSDRRTRIAFVTGLAAQQARNPFPPDFHLFAKGDGAQKFILVSVNNQKYRTLYQMRALLAGLTALSRNTPVFQDHAMPENLTFLDLCKLMGVEQLTISDGDVMAHQITIK